MPKTLSFLIIFALSLGLARAGWSCSCVPLTVSKKIELADVIFVGKVISTEVPGRTAFEVTGYWKGPVRKTMVLESLSRPEYFDTCELFFRVGHEYLVYSDGRGRLTTSICSGSAPTTRATQDLEQLGPPRMPK